MPKQLYMVKYDSDSAPTLRLEHDPYADESRPAKPEEITLEAVAHMLDHDAENINAHDYVRCHAGLAALLLQEVGREAATRVFVRLAGFRGLHGMLGVCGRTDPAVAEKELGVSLS
jgi:hypothetical protein